MKSIHYLAFLFAACLAASLVALDDLHDKVEHYKKELNTLLSDFCVLQTGEPEHMYMELSDGKVYFCATKHGDFQKLKRGERNVEIK